MDLTDADPCTTISDEALAAIGSAPAKSGADQTRPTEFSCSYRDFDSPYGSALTFDASTGYEKYGATATGVIVTPIDVAGFRAYSVEKPSRAACTVGVDVADSQSLAATTIGTFDAPSAPLCNKAAEFAAVAINALTSK